MLVEFSESENGVNYISLVIHDDDSSGSQTRSSIFEIIEVHDSLFALLFDQHGYRRAARNDGFEVIPTSKNTTTMSVDQLSEWNGHLLFNSDWVVDVTRNAEKLGSRVLWSTEGGEP